MLYFYLFLVSPDCCRKKLEFEGESGDCLIRSGSQFFSPSLQSVFVQLIRPGISFITGMKQRMEPSDMLFKSGFQLLSSVVRAPSGHRIPGHHSPGVGGGVRRVVLSRGQSSEIENDETKRTVDSYTRYYFKDREIGSFF